MAIPTAAAKPLAGSAASKPTFAPPEFKGEAVPSIIPREVTHVVLAGGFYGSGKTTLLCGIDRPENLLFIDFEGKGEGVAIGAGVENYFCPPQEVAALYGFAPMKEAIWDRTKRIVEAIEPGRFKGLILDGLLILQDSMHMKVLGMPAHEQKGLGADPKNVVSGSMGGAWPGVGTLLQNLANVARAKGVQVIGVTSEAKPKWSNTGPVLNKFELKGQSMIHKMSILSLIMMPGLPRYAGAPAGLVLKEQLGSFERDAVTGIGKPRKRLPPKLPLATMAEVYRYLREPADWSFDEKTGQIRLKPEEIPSKEEMEPFLPTISKDQLASMRELLELARLGGQEVESE